jgi:hypothetical protein
LDSQERPFYGPRNGGAGLEISKEEQKPSREMKLHAVEPKHQCAAQRSLGYVQQYHYWSIAFVARNPSYVTHRKAWNLTHDDDQ